MSLRLLHLLCVHLSDFYDALFSCHDGFLHQLDLSSLNLEIFNLLLHQLVHGFKFEFLNRLDVLDSVIKAGTCTVPQLSELSVVFPGCLDMFVQIRDLSVWLFLGLRLLGGQIRHIGLVCGD